MRYAAHVTDTLSCSHTWGRVRLFLVSLSFLILWKPFPYGLSATVTLCVARGRGILEKEHSGCGWKRDIQKYKRNCPCFRVERQTRVWETHTDEHCTMRGFRRRMSKSERRRDAGRKREWEREEESMSVSGPWCFCLLCSSLITCQINSFPSAAHHVCVCVWERQEERQVYRKLSFTHCDISSAQTSPPDARRGTIPADRPLEISAFLLGMNLQTMRRLFT